MASPLVAAVRAASKIRADVLATSRPRHRTSIEKEIRKIVEELEG